MVSSSGGPGTDDDGPNIEEVHEDYVHDQGPHHEAHPDAPPVPGSAAPQVPAAPRAQDNVPLRVVSQQDHLTAMEAQR
eukprot:7523436-Prorocentrum_lima.AAC.1